MPKPSCGVALDNPTPGPSLALLCIGLALAGLAEVRAEDWPQWRGPQLNGTSTETGLPVRWSTTQNIT